MKINFKKIHENARIPEYAHCDDSGMDIRTIESCSLAPFERHTFKTGICAEIPWGHELQVRPRSGLSSHGIVAMWGTVDQGYRGEIGVTLINISNVKYDVFVGDKIAQLVCCPTTHCEVCEVDSISNTERGNAGFGSTGR